MSSEKIEVGKCPVCDRDGFANVAALIAHIKYHNEQDDEVGKSVVAEQEEYLKGMF